MTRFTLRSFAAGSKIITQGEQGTTFYIVQQGTCVVSINQAPNSDATHSTLTIAELRQGDHFGEMALLNNEPRTANVIAETPVTCFELERQDFAMIIEPYQAQITEDAQVRRKSLEDQHRDMLLDKDIDWRHIRNLGIVGSGTFGTVALALDERTNTTYAMKILDKQKVKSLRQDKRLETEKNLLVQMSSDFICSLYSVHEDSTAHYLLLELVQGGELQKLIHSRSGHGIPHQPAKFYTACIALALAYLHKRHVAYRDLKVAFASAALHCLLPLVTYASFLSMHASR